MITFHNVNKRYRLREGYKVILEDVSLHLPDANIGILGANGAGKSTLLRMISGAEHPDAGMIECHRKVSFPLGFSASFNGSLTGIENTLFVSRIYGQDTEAVVEFVKEFSQLEDQLYMPVNTYSSGMRARLAFGVSLAIDFEMYLVDEITAVGDARFKQRSKQAFKDKLGHATMLMVSHSMSTLRDYCDSGLVLQDGQLTYYEDLEEAIRHHNRNMGEEDEPAGAAAGRRPGHQPGRRPGGKNRAGRNGPGAAGRPNAHGRPNAQQGNRQTGAQARPGQGSGGQEL